MFTSKGNKTQNSKRKVIKKMTTQLVKQIKNILKKENVKVVATYHDRNGELRIKVNDFMIRSKYNGVTIQPDPINIRNKTATGNIVKVLNALSRNGLRPEYRTEQRETSNCLASYDSRYIIFK